MRQEAFELFDMLPESEQLFACEFIKRLVLAWDPDFTKLTPKEATDIEKAIEEMKNGEYVRHEDINWD
jgi:hypothetical protein